MSMDYEDKFDAIKGVNRNNWRRNNAMAKRKKDKRNGHLQSTTQKTKDRATRTSLKPGVNLSVMNVLTVRPLALVARYDPTRNNNGHLYVLFNVG